MMGDILTMLATGKMKEVVKCTIVNSEVVLEAAANVMMNVYDDEYN